MIDMCSVVRNIIRDTSCIGTKNQLYTSNHDILYFTNILSAPFFLPPQYQNRFTTNMNIGGNINVTTVPDCSPKNN